jgi:DNA-binding CsgD family transcriptional regulator
MGARVVQAQDSAASQHAAPDFPVKLIVRKLIAEVQQRTSPDHPNDNQPPRDVLIDIEVDGVRCVLSKAEKQTTPHAILSPRELEIARMIARGYPNKTIAAALDISSWTVCTHLRRSFSKLGVTSRAAMIARMAESGLLEGQRISATA